MRTTTGISLWIVRITGIVQLLMGITFWTGHALTFVPLHIVIGFVLVLALWTIAVMALVVRARTGLAVFALLWGLALPALGMPQASILAGPMHRIIQVIHLVMGVFAVAVAITLGKAILADTPDRGSQADLERGAAAARRAS